jgi:hypothetical protein
MRRPKSSRVQRPVLTLEYYRSAVKSVVANAVTNAAWNTAVIVFMSAVSGAQEPVAPRPTHTRPPLDSLEPLNTEAVDSAYRRQRNARCWRARPMPDCRMVFLTDFGIDFPISTTRAADPGARFYARDFDVRMAWSIGLMRNGRRHSHGVSFALTSEPARAIPMIAEYRYRQWRGPMTFDAALGLKRHEVWIDKTGLVEGRGLTTMLGASPSRWIGLSLRYERMRVRGTTRRGVLVGLQSTRASEHVFRIIALGIVDALLGSIGFERDTTSERIVIPSAATVIPSVSAPP